MDFTELTAKAAAQSEARTKNFKDYLAGVRQERDKESNRIQRIFAKAGEQLESELKSDMDAQIAAEKERVEAKVKEEYAKRHHPAEWNGNDDAPFRKLLGGLLGVKK